MTVISREPRNRSSDNTKRQMAAEIAANMGPETVAVQNAAVESARNLLQVTNYC